MHDIGNKDIQSNANEHSICLWYTFYNGWKHVLYTNYVQQQYISHRPVIGKINI